MFDWDAGNTNKNLVHGVHDWEIEEACQDPRSRVIDHQWVPGELRSVLLGQSAASGRYVRVVYTLRRDLLGRELLRPISAVEMTAAERRRYQRK